MFRNLALASVFALAVGLVGCDESTVSPATDGIVEFSPVFDLTLPPDGGTCPDVFYEEMLLLDNGVTVTWTSVIAGFDYTLGADYVGTVIWSVDLGSATHDGFGTKNGPNTWTPKGKSKADVGGIMTPGTPGEGTIDVTVSMDPMHLSEEDYDLDGIIDWEGRIGNGHFWLFLTVDDGEGNAEEVKLGVNFHLEDPAEGYGNRCPS